MNVINWQITTGCESLGGGCVSCPSLHHYKDNNWDYTIQEHRARFVEPIVTAKPTCFLVSLGSDLFHRLVSDKFIIEAFEVMNKCPEHNFEIATKRLFRAVALESHLTWSENIMIGTSIESQEYKYRMEILKQIPTKNRFISFAPLLGDVGEIDMSGIKIAGACGEDWELRRPFDPKWLENIRRQCLDQDVQWINTHAIFEKEIA